jgi:tRNA (guanine37-N1)-methyltransferase
LLSGDHEKIRRWRRRTALAKTRNNRPDLLQSAQLSNEDRALLKEIEADEAKGPF